MRGDLQVTELDHMARPEIEIVIPVQRESAQLDLCLRLLVEHTRNFKLSVVEEPGLNVSEARQMALDEIVTRDLVCFLDDDSEMIMDGWLDMMHRVLFEQKDAGAVFCGEWWGTDDPPAINPTADAPAHNHLYRLFNAAVFPGGCEPFVEVEKGPAACMLIDRRRIPPGLRWNADIGLRSGWLGGDFEEVEYCQRLRVAGLRLYRATRTLFHHTGGKRTMKDFVFTDRFKTVNIMQLLLRYRAEKAPEDEDWFKGLQYVKARDDDDLMLEPGQSLRTCYRDVVCRNGLQYVRAFNKMGLV